LLLAMGKRLPRLSGPSHSHATSRSSISAFFSPRSLGHFQKAKITGANPQGDATPGDSAGTGAGGRACGDSGDGRDEVLI